MTGNKTWLRKKGGEGRLRKTQLEHLNAMAKGTERKSGKSPSKKLIISGGKERKSYVTVHAEES